MDRALRSRIESVSGHLATSLGAVIEALPGSPARPGELAAGLGLNRDISGRVLSVTRARDPFQAVHTAPGPAPLRRLLRAARGRGLDEALLRDAEEAVRQFDLLIRDLGHRDTLDALIATVLPEVRARHEQASRLSAFRGLSHLKGAFADLWLQLVLIHPSAGDPLRHDVVYVYGALGLRCLRPEVRVKFSYHEWGRDTRSEWETLDGRPPREAHGTELDRYCVNVPAQLELIETGSGLAYMIDGAPVGAAHAVDKLLAEVRRSAMRRHAAARPRNLKSVSVSPAVPVRTLLFDLLLHEEAFPGAEPTLVFYDTTIDGMASVNDPSRDMDRLDFAESVSFQGRGAATLAVSRLPGYVDLVEHVCDGLGWDASAFRGYRCSMHYPMYGAQVTLAFSAPPLPG